MWVRDATRLPIPEVISDSYHTVINPLLASAMACCCITKKPAAEKFKPLNNATLSQQNEVECDSFTESLPVPNSAYHEYTGPSAPVNAQPRASKYVTVAASAPKSPKGAPKKDYHHGRITRERAEHLLKRSQGPDGTFLVRESNDSVSTDSSTLYVLSVLTAGTVAHIEMKRDESGKYHLKDTPGSKPFASIPKVVLHYQHKSLDLQELGTVKLCCYIPVSDSEHTNLIDL